MKKIKLVFLLTPLILIACSPPAKDTTKRFVIVDRNTNAALETYEYDADSKLVTTKALNDEQRVRSTTNYLYDENGNLSRMVTNNLDGTIRTIDFSYREITDAQGRVCQTIQTGSDGSEIVTHYGYDETGALRGVVQDNGTSLIMKDY